MTMTPADSTPLIPTTRPTDDIRTRKVVAIVLAVVGVVMILIGLAHNIVGLPLVLEATQNGESIFPPS